MAKAREVDIVLNAVHDEFSTGVRKSRKDLQGFGDEVKKTGGQLDALKNTFGRGSTFNQVEKLFKGAGAIAGIGLLVGGVKSAAQGMSDFNNKVMMGEATATDFKDRFVQMIPIVGELGIALDEAFTGKRFAEKMARETKLAVDEMRRGTEAMDREYEISRMSGPEQKLAEREQKKNLDIGAVELNLEHQRKGKQPWEIKQLENEADLRERSIQWQAEEDEHKIQAEADAEKEALTKAHNQHIAEINGIAAVARLHAGENAGAAELTTLTMRYDKERAVVAAELAKKLALERDFNRTKEAQDRAAEETAALNAAEQAERELNQARALRDMKKAMADGEFSARQAMLHATGQDETAALEALDNEFKKRQKEIEDDRKNALGGLRPADTGKADEINRDSDKRQKDLRDEIDQRKTADQQKQERERLDIEIKANEKMLDQRKNYMREADQINAEIHDAQLRHEGKGKQADKEKLDRELQLKKDQIQEELQKLGPDADTSAADALGAALTRQHDQAVKFAEAPERTALPAAVERRFDFTLPGVQNPISQAMKEQIAHQKYLNKKADRMAAGIEKLAAKTALGLIGIL